MHTVLSASTLINDEVKNHAGENLGKIEDMMLDVENGRISYAVLSFGGFLGLGDKLFAIPWTALNLNTNEKCFYLNVDQERLEDAPGFNKDNWPNMADPEWNRSVHNFYNVAYKN